MCIYIYIYEYVDALYQFALILCCRCITQVERRPGDAKPEFIKAHMAAKPAATPAPAPASAPAAATEFTPGPRINGEPVLKMLKASDIPPLHRDPGECSSRLILVLQPEVAPAAVAFTCLFSSLHASVHLLLSTSSLPFFPPPYTLRSFSLPPPSFSLFPPLFCPPSLFPVVNPKARKIAEDILSEIRSNGEAALLATSIRLGTTLALIV